jgi:hypothetical protein
MDDTKKLARDNEALRPLTSTLGFEPDRIIETFEGDHNLWERIALSAQRVCRDFSETGFTDKGVAEGHKWLDTLLSDAAKNAPYRCKPCIGGGLVTRDMGDFLPEAVWCPACQGSGRIRRDAPPTRSPMRPEIPPALRHLEPTLLREIESFGAARTAMGRCSAVREYVLNGTSTSGAPNAPFPPKNEHDRITEKDAK